MSSPQPEYKCHGIRNIQDDILACIFITAKKVFYTCLVNKNTSFIVEPFLQHSNFLTIMETVKKKVRVPVLDLEILNLPLFY